MEASQSADQTKLNDEAAAISALGPKLDTIKSEIDALKNQPGAAALDFSGVDTAVASVGGQADADVAEGAPPAPPAPAA